MQPSVTRRRFLSSVAVGAGAMFGLAACGTGQQATTGGSSSSSGVATTSSNAATSSALATTSAAATRSGASASSGSSAASSVAAASTSSAASSASALQVVNGQLTHGGVSPTPRNQTVIIDQSLFTVFDSFNPYIPNGQEYEAGVTQFCREYLWYNDFATGQLIPWLGESWSYNSDYTQCTLKLNPKPTWSDGKPFTSADVAFTFNMLLKNTALLPSKGVQEYLDSVSTPDAQTVVMKLKKPNPRWHEQFITNIIGSFIVSPQHIWESQDPTTFKNNPPIYTGPYVLDRVLQADYMYIWKKNPNYWNKAALDPKPAYVVVRSAPTQDSGVEEFQRGLTDIGSFDFLHAQHLNQSYKDMIIEDGFLDPCPTAVMVNSDPSKGVLADSRFRWALSYLLDREKIGKIFYSPPFQAAKYPWPAWKSNDKWNVPSVQQQYDMVYDPKKAAALLQQMGATMGSNGILQINGKPLSFSLTTPSQVGQSDYQAAQYFSQEAKKAGIELNLKYQQGATFYHQNQAGQYDIAWCWLCGQVDDPVQLYNKFLPVNSAPIGQLATGGWDATRLNDSTLNDLTQKLDNVTPDLSNADTKKMYDDAFAEWMKQLPFIPVNQKVLPAIYNTKYWKGWPTNQNLYQVPSDWWGQFLFVIAKLEPA